MVSKIKNPETALIRKQQGYYNYLNGLMVSQTNLNKLKNISKKLLN
jgi:hypothetical protein